MPQLIEYLENILPEEIKPGDPDYKMAMDILDSIESGQNDCMSLEEYKKQLGIS